MKHMISMCVVMAVALVLGLGAQANTVLQVAYETVVVDAFGVETPHAEGVHYIAADGRYRHDESVDGERVSSYRLGDDNVSVNHNLGVAVRGGAEAPLWNPYTMRRFVPGASALPGTGFDPKPPRSLGQRALGPMLLQGFTHDLGAMTVEIWEYGDPRTAVDPDRYIPVVIELTASMNDGSTTVRTRATGVQRLAESADIFDVPYSR